MKTCFSKETKTQLIKGDIAPKNLFLLTYKVGQHQIKQRAGMLNTLDSQLKVIVFEAFMIMDSVQLTTKRYGQDF